ncbi:MAG: hypothetical protein CMJ53_11805 [Planctomycetaceae bacterium]|nr:hypothetical protein [Planctomycetaceae bacterium]
MMMRILSSLVVFCSCVGVLQADQTVVQIHASSSGTLNASDCCTMTHMGSVAPDTIWTRNCQSVYMDCIGSRRAGVWQFDLSSIPAGATLISARFKGTRSEEYMTGSGFLRMRFDSGPLSSSACLTLWNGGGWQSNTYWPYGHDFNFNITAGLSQHFGTASTVSLLGYSAGSSSVVITNTGPSAPMLEVTYEGGTPACAGDLDDNGVVDGPDLALILGFWGSDNATYDLDGSGLIDGADLTIILAAWGECAG